MKTIAKLSISIFVMLNYSLVFSQDYIKFPEEGAMWHIKSISCGDQQCQNYDTYLEYTGDTIINGIKQSIIGDFFVVDTNKIVYATNFDDYFIEYDDSVVLYDFNLNLNDTFKLYNTSYDTVHLVVYEIDSLLINDEYRTRIKLDAKIPKVDFLDTLIWVEGIGSNFGPIYIPFLPSHEYNRYLYCYRLDNEKHFGECVTVSVSNKKASQKTALIYPNPVIDRSYLVSPVSGTGLLEIYNCNGQLVTKEEFTGEYLINAEDFEKGIYFFILSDFQIQKATGKFIVR